jgi:hypothetical protein
VAIEAQGQDCCSQSSHCRSLFCKRTLCESALAHDHTAVVLNPRVGAVQGSGIALNTPMALTTMRASFGAFPLACGIVALVCLVSGRRNRMGLWFISIVIGIVLAVRCYGIEIDGTLSGNQRVLSAELVLFSIAVVALLIGRAAGAQSSAEP